MDMYTTKNILKMMYDGKIRKITDKCLLLPDNSLFNIDGNKIINLSERVYRVEGYNNLKFVYARCGNKSVVCNVDGDIILHTRDCVKPRIYKISSCEYIIITNIYVFIYNTNVKGLTKVLKYTNIFIDNDNKNISLSYMENNIHMIKLNILAE